MDGLSRTKHWAWGAVIAVLCSFAYAKGPVMSHGGGAAAGAAPAPHALRSAMAHRDSHAQRGNPNIANANFGYGFGNYRSGMRRVGDPFGFAGMVRPVSTESRPVPHPPPNMPVRSGSIRADVARYNEERGAGRPMQRPADDPRPPEGSPYRN
ncbi:hypothetical protein LJ655_08055 [Paraburkholderia sp. MMS20-SJTN17]|uniref:Peptide-binding protein n=1 Tax=Paraburkholderia translucens TaxID=2886945 RepID=A0ABS8KAT6_9BURK|nr:hypothetical protein [Paraburkholderia sp. MMS20-SJTN17]MCC8401844.1 hypothetical protein [Paraburkholderia sp. MMS20-SJTN17]